MKKLIVPAVCVSMLFCACAAEQEEQTVNTTASEAETETETQDTIVITEEPQQDKGYIEGDNYIIYYGEGALRSDDDALNVEDIMGRLEDMYGMSYDFEGYECPTTGLKALLLDGNYEDVNTDGEKMEIFVVKDQEDGSIENADSNEIVLFDYDLDEEGMYYGTAVHELTHLLRLRQSPCLGLVMEEGIALYSQDVVTRELGLPDWDMIQFIDSDTYLISYDDSVIVNDPEQAFRDASAGTDQDNYQYGIRFVYYLVDRYGIGVIDDISATARNYDYSYDDPDTIIAIIKEATDDDVFTNFAQWLPENWTAYSDAYLEYMEPFGI